MKIGIIITHPTQFDVPIYRLGKEFIDVIYIDRNKIKEVYDPELKRIVTFQNNNLEGYKYELLPNGFKGILWLFKKIKNGNYDLLITNGYSKFIYILTLILGKLYAKKNAIRVDTVMFNNPSKMKFFLKRVLYSILDRLIDCFFVTSSLAKEFVKNCGIPASKTAYYGYVSDNDFFAQESDISDQEKYEIKRTHQIDTTKKVILCVSKHNLREAPFDTLRAFSLCNSPDIHLLIIGDGPNHQDLVQLSKDLNISSISFIGYVNFNLLPKYYAISDLFIHDTHNEPWGVSVQEAIACGVTVIASDKVGAAHDLIIEGINGFVFKAGDVSLLSKKITDSLILNSEKKRSANEEILNKWNYQTTLENILRVV